MPSGLARAVERRLRWRARCFRVGRGGQGAAGVQGAASPRFLVGLFAVAVCGCSLKAAMTNKSPCETGGEASGGAQGGEKRELASATSRSGQASERAGWAGYARTGDGAATPRSAADALADERAQAGERRPKPEPKKAARARRVGHVWDWQPARRASFRTLIQRPAGRHQRA